MLGQHLTQGDRSFSVPENVELDTATVVGDCACFPSEEVEGLLCESVCAHMHTHVQEAFHNSCPEGWS